jgi:hypothetical protein
VVHRCELRATLARILGILMRPHGAAAGESLLALSADDANEVAIEADAHAAGRAGDELQQ